MCTTTQQWNPNQQPHLSSQRFSSSPCSGDDDSTLSCCLKERDYIGMAAEVSSVPSSHQSENEAGLNVSETDLRLGLGPFNQDKALAIDKISEGIILDTASELRKNDPERESKDAPQPRTMDTGNMGSAVCIIPSSQYGSDGLFHTRDNANMSSSMFHTWHNMSLKNVDVKPNCQLNGFSFSSAIGASPKNGCKRMYADTMVDATRESGSAFSTMKPGMPNAINACDVRPCANLPTGQATYTKHFHGNPSHRRPVVNLPNVSDDVPLAKDQVVGWPPVPSHRRSSLPARLNPTAEDKDGRSACYVKVNMDGIPIGRKIDLIAYSSYEGLLEALEEMFRNPNSGHGTRFLNGSDFFLTYEDKEGDWMLVGDVPWRMFICTVRRLRISRGLDVSGLGS